MRYLIILMVLFISNCANDPNYEFGDHTKTAVNVVLTAAELAIIFCELHPDHQKCSKNDTIDKN